MFVCLFVCFAIVGHVKEMTAKKSGNSMAKCKSYERFAFLFFFCYCSQWIVSNVSRRHLYF